MGKKIYIVGAGIFGTVMAEKISNKYNKEVIVIDQRDHIGGNCYTFDDKETKINCHKYGAHIFHTSNEKVYKYITSFVKLNSYRHFVMTNSNGQTYSMPIGLRTINKFYNKNFTPSECKAFLEKIISNDHIEDPKNLEEQAISLIGRDLYYAFIRGYTKKQWQRDPKLLPAAIIKRLPFRTNYCSDYFNDVYQGIPEGGYTPFFEKLLSNSKIKVNLSTAYEDIKNEISSDDLLIYTGQIDQLFDYKFGKLNWRTLRFEWKNLKINDYQGCAVLNEADEDVPYTRTHEFKHFHPERKDIFNSNMTTICREYSAEYKDGDTPYYPINDEKNLQLYLKYENEAKQSQGIILGGRLGTYKYMDMDQVIAQAMDTYDRNKELIKSFI